MVRDIVLFMIVIPVMILVVCIIQSSVQTNDRPVVNTAIGVIRGVMSDDGQYNMYMGVPYAKVNETNPFGESIPHPYFEEIFEATDDSSMCPQIDKFNHTVVGDLDCLSLNIYTPTNVDYNSRLPVFVYIFGGRFIKGTYGRFVYGPKFLVKDDIIVVTMNYRLGVYGFMCLDIPEVPGNQGLKDQIAALRWIKSHISAFGGDPKQITIGGHSSGAMSVDFHLHRDNTEEKLFEKVILQSGNTFSTLFRMPVRNAPIILAKHLDFETDDIHTALDFLTTVPPHDLVVAQKSLGLAIDTICIEKAFDGVENYLTTNWFLQKSIPAVNKMKVLIGFTDDEMACYTATEISDELANWFNTQHEDFKGMIELVDQFYTGDELIGADNFESQYNLSSDLTFVHPTYRILYKYIDNNVGDIYLYKFMYIGDINFSRVFYGINAAGACHADELSYLFDMQYLPGQPSADDQLIINKMTKMWTNFVKYGDPTPALSELIDTKWLPVRHNSPLYTMNINTQLSLDTSSVAGRMTFWDVFYEKNGHLQWPSLISY